VRAISLNSQYGIQFWDALLVATMQRHGITTIFTENTGDFEKCPGIKAVNPLKR